MYLEVENLNSFSQYTHLKVCNICVCVSSNDLVYIIYMLTVMDISHRAVESC